MKKKGLVIQSAIMLALAFIMLTTASFAWFANQNTAVGGFSVDIAEKTKVEVEFFLKKGAEYESVTAGESFTFFNEIMYPGKIVECRIKVKNIGKDGSLKISFFDTAYRLQVAEGVDPDASLEHLSQMLGIVANWGYDGQVKTEEKTVNIMEQLGVPTQTSTEVSVLDNIALASNQIVEIDYRFYLSKDTANIDGLFSLSCKGIRFLVM